MLSDLRFAFRQLAKAPGFTATIVVTLALSIGASVTIFVLIDSVLLRGYGADPARSVAIFRKLPSVANGMSPSIREFYAWKTQLKSFDLLTAHFQQDLVFASSLTSEGEPIRAGTRWVTERFFEFYNRVVLGRGFLPEEHVGERGNVVVFSHSLWQGAFGGRKDIIGRSVALNGTPYTVIGIVDVAPLPPEDQADVYIPGHLDPERPGRTPVSYRGMLKAGVTLAQSQAEMDVLTARLAQEYPDIDLQGATTVVTPLHDYVARNSRAAILTLFGAVGCVLLIACANISSLLLVRATARQREFALRVAFGASRVRLVRQLFVESLLLAGVAGAAGVLIAEWTCAVLQTYPNIKNLGTTHFELGGVTTLFAIGVTFLTAVLFGLLPAWLSSRVDLNDSLKQGSRGSTESRGQSRLRQSLVVLEIACATVLLAAAGLFVRSFIRVTQIDPGFVPQNAVRLTVSSPREKYGSGEQQSAFADAVIARIAALPGVEAVGVTQFIPFASTSSGRVRFQIEGLPVDDSVNAPRTAGSVVSPGFFAAMGIRLIRGRILTEQDDAHAPRVALINEAFARQNFPGVDPLGRRMRTLGARASEEWCEIVGVVADVTQSSPELPVGSQVYRPFRQRPGSQMNIIVRTKGEIAGLGQTLKAQVYAVDPMQSVLAIRPLQEILDDRVSTRRFQLHLLTAFSLLALAIAVVGIYGVIAYSVTQRTTEFGIRMALGAQSSDVARLVVAQGARLVGIGLSIGLAGALVVGRIIEARLFQVSAFDPLTLITITVLIAGAGILAGIVPVRRATKVDPIVALRAE